MFTSLVLWMGLTNGFLYPSELVSDISLWHRAFISTTPCFPALRTALSYTRLAFSAHGLSIPPHVLALLYICVTSNGTWVLFVCYQYPSRCITAMDSPCIALQKRRERNRSDVYERARYTTAAMSERSNSGSNQSCGAFFLPFPSSIFSSIKSSPPLSSATPTL